MIKPCFGSLLALGALVGCSPPAPMPPPPPPICGGATLAPLTLVAGGRAEVPLGGLTSELSSVTSTSGAEVSRDGDRLVVRAGYGEPTATLTLGCMHGSIDVPVTIQPLSMTPLLRWDGSTVDAPGGREYFGFWVGDDDALYLYGGFVYVPRQFTPSTEAFRLDLMTSTWSRLSTTGTPPAPGGRVAAGPSGSVLYFGGGLPMADGSLDTPPALLMVQADADGASFDSMPRSSGAPGSYTGAFVHDEARDRWLSVCGVDTRALGLHCAVHSYTEGEGFVRLEVEGESPPGRYGFHYALDAANDRVIVFAGQTGPGNSDIGGDTWALWLAPEDGGLPRWEQLFGMEEARESGVSHRRNGAFAFDPIGRRLLVWGGTPDGRVAVPGLDVLSLERGREAWTHVELDADVPPRTSGGGVYDAARGRILWGFGNSAAIYTDLYSLSVVPTGAI